MDPRKLIFESSCDSKNKSKVGMSVQEAREFRDSVVLQQKQARKSRVDEIVAKSLSLEDTEKKLRAAILRESDHLKFSVEVLNVVTNDWDSPDRHKIRSEVYTELRKKYLSAFEGAEIEENDVGNQSMSFYLKMRL